MGKLQGLGRWGVLCSVLTLLSTGSAGAQGIILPGAGAMHRSMAGVSTATGVDALGSLYWNPAAISLLPRSEVVIGGELLIPDIHLGSTVPAGAFGPLGPAVTQTGLTRSDNGVSLIPDIGVVYQVEDSPLSIGLGLVTLAGGSVNFPGDASNPVLAPTGPLNQFILGPQAATASILAIEPTIAYRVTDDFAIGVSPMIDISMVSFDPAFFGPTSQARVIDPRQFPTGTHTRPFWGGGFRAGLTCRALDYLVIGFLHQSAVVRDVALQRP
jgi:long-chain fatty acid transport protein